MSGPGAIVVVDFVGARLIKKRPAVVVSTDLYHATRPDVVLGVLTGKVRSAIAPTDYILKDWAAAGLRVPTAFRCYFVTVPASQVDYEVGRLSDRDWQEVQARLRAALAVT